VDVKFEMMRRSFERPDFWVLFLLFLFVSRLLAPFVGCGGRRVEAGAVDGWDCGFRVAWAAGGEVDEREGAEEVLGGGTEGVGLRVRWEADVALVVAVDSTSVSVARCSCCSRCWFWICDFRKSSSMP